MSSRRKSASLDVAMSATCAVLYAMGSYLTAYTSSPWGSGQFRPAVVIPSVFSAVFGPLVGGAGAAVGTLIADSIKHGQIYIRSLVSAVPGNFVGFYLFGILVRKFSWENFVKAAQAGLLVGNSILAFLYVYYRTFVDASFPAVFRGSWIYVSLGYLAWFYVTGLPFVLLLGPPIIRAIVMAFPAIAPGQMRYTTVRGETPRKSFSLAMICPGLLMLLVGISLALTDSKWILEKGIASDAVILAGMQAMFAVGGAILLLLGIGTLVTRRFTGRPK